MPLRFAEVFSQLEFYRRVASFLGANTPALLQLGKMCLASVALAGRALHPERLGDRARLWCLACLWRWQWHPWNLLRLEVSPQAIAGAEAPYTVAPNPGEETPFGW